MSPFYIFLLAVSLAMDALSVAVGLSLRFRWVSFRQFFRLSFHFGLFQFMMPVIGWMAGTELVPLIGGFDHWVAFLLLGFIGIKLIKDSLGGGEQRPFVKDPTRGRWLVMLSVATSIDALAVGLSLSLLDVSIWIPSLVIGLVAATFTLFGMYFGNRLRGRGTRYLGVAGGAMLILIGLKILIEGL